MGTKNATNATTEKVAKNTTAAATKEIAENVSQTYAASAVTTELTGEQTSPATEIPLDKAKIVVEGESAPAQNTFSAKELAALDSVDQSLSQRVIDSGLGLVKVLGTDFRYIGIAPARDENPQTPDGIPVRPSNTTFTPLSEVAFDASIQIKDPATGKFFYANPGDTWATVQFEGNHLISGEADPAYARARREAAHFAKFGSLPNN